MATRKAKIQGVLDSDESQTTPTTSTTKRKAGGKRSKETINDDLNAQSTTDFAEVSKSQKKAKTGGRTKKSSIGEQQKQQETINFKSHQEEKPQRGGSRKKKDDAVASKPTDGRKRSDNRQVLVAADMDSGKLHGIFLDAGHAAFILGLKVADIKSDTNKGTKKTKLAWMKVPAGGTLDQKEIERGAKIAFKEWKATGGVPAKKKPGRKPAHVDPNELNNMIKKADINKLDDKTMRKLRNLLAKAGATA
jgi:hypothetical protein